MQKQCQWRIIPPSRAVGPTADESIPIHSRTSESAVVDVALRQTLSKHQRIDRRQFFLPPCPSHAIRGLVVAQKKAVGKLVHSSEKVPTIPLVDRRHVTVSTFRESPSQT
uniref:Uncharacterized protein n=1 Tax=Plectus sambesii TaxID=2011161 RepID=A0A914X8N0_9BILA